MSTIRKRGTKWQVQIRRKGIAPLTRSFSSKSDAREWARHCDVLADRQDLPQNTKILETITLRDLVIRYRDEVVPAKRGAEVETIVLNAFLREPICSKRLAVLTTTDFAAYRDRRLNKVTSTTLKRQLAPLHNMFEIARTEWAIPLKLNPLGKLVLKANNERRCRRLREGELARLLSAIQKTRNPLILPIVRLALETAMRRGEILAMRWCQVDLQRRWLVIPETKNGHSRTIPLTPQACALLQRPKGAEDRVFPLTANALRLSWERAVERADIMDLHFHDLRHEAVSRFFEIGLSVPEVAAISGHRDIRMLMRYAHADNEKLLFKLSGRIGPA